MASTTGEGSRGSGSKKKYPRPPVSKAKRATMTSKAKKKR